MSALTRILNNQIYNGTIIASQKIAAGTITGSLFSSNVTVPGDLLISGNLFVLGTSAYTTIASTNTYVNDPLIVLNNGFSSTNTYDEGLIFNRGSLLNQAFIWSEFNKEFRLIGTAETGTTYGNVSVTNFANLHIGNLTVDYAAAIGSLSLSGGISAASLNVSGNVLASAGVFNGLTVNGNESVTGYLNVTGNVMAAVVTASQFNTTGNLLASQARLNYLDVNGNVDLGLAGAVSGSWVNIIGNITQTSSGGAVYFNTTGNISAAVGAFGAINSTGYINTSGNISTAQLNAGQINTTGNVLATAGTFNALTINGNETISGFINAAGNISTPQLNAGQINTTGNVLATAGVFNGLTVNGNESVTGYLNVTGNVLAATGVFGGVNTTGYINAGGNVSTPQLNAGQINTTGNVLATAGVFNGLTVNGNETVTGYLNVTGNIIAATAELGSVEATGTIYANSSAATTTQGTGALIVPTGGISVAGAANIAGAITTAGAAQFNNTITIGGISSFANTTNATDATGSTGALRIQGGASIAKDLWVGGNLYAANIYGVTQEVITVKDPLLYLEAANTFPYSYEIGMFSQFTGADPVTGTGNAYQHTGLVRDHLDYTWKFFSNVRAEPSGTVPFNSDTIYDPVRAGNLTLTYTQAATSTTTGALKVAGGAGIAGTVVAGQLNSTGNVLGQAATFNALTVNGNETVTGYLNVTGNIIAATAELASVEASGSIYANSTQAVSGILTSVGALVVPTGGAAIAGALNLGGTAQIGVSSANYVSIIGTGAGGYGIVRAGGEATNGLLLSAGGTGNIVFNAVTSATVGTATNFLVYNAIQAGATNYIYVAGSGSGSSPVLGTDGVDNNFGLIIKPKGTGNVTISATNASTSTTTGALTVGGGVGVGGNIFQSGAYLDTSSSNYILAGTPTTVNAFNAATALIVGATSGTLTLRNPTIISSSNSINVFNTVAATLNFGGAANITMGHTDGTTTLQGNANVRAVTTSLTYTQGALVVAGGVGIAGNLSIASNSPGKLTIGSNSVVYSENIVQVSASANTASRISIQNTNSGTLATSEFMAIANNGSNTANQHLVGITSTTYTNSGASIIKPLDSYDIAVGGNLVVASSNDVVIAAGGLSAIDIRVSATNSNVGIQYNTAATSPTTGAFTVVGGAGINANLYVNNGTIFNYGQSSEDFIVQGKVTTSLIRAVSNYGAVIIGGSNASPQLGSTLKINGTDSVLIPVGTSAQRPSSSGNTDATGMMRFNTTINNLEFYDGTVWQTPGGTFTIISDRQFSGNTAGGYGNVDGTNTSFTLQSSSTTSATIISINGVLQIPVLAYSISGTTLTFTEPPAPGDVIDARVLSTSVTVSSLASGSGLNQFIADDTNGAEIWSGTSTTIRRAVVDPAGNFNLLTGNKVTYTQVAVNAPAVGATIIDTWSQSAYTTAKYVIQAKVGSTRVESYEAMVLTDGTGNAYVSTYGVINNGTTFGTILANVSGGNVNVYFNTTIAQANVKALGTFIV